DGHTVTFLSTSGYTGPASFQVQADDGYGTSAPATVSVNVSAAPLVKLDFAQRNPRLNPGEPGTAPLVGDFPDQQEVALPSSYVTFETTDPTVATVSASGLLNAVANGTAVLLASSHGIQAATAVLVGTPTDLTQQLLAGLGLTVYPQAVSLAAPGGTRQLQIS